MESKGFVANDSIQTTGGSVKEVMNLVEKAKAKTLGVGVLVDRSNGGAQLHNNQYSIFSFLKVNTYYAYRIL